jgi:hypothetical protein
VETIESMHGRRSALARLSTVVLAPWAFTRLSSCGALIHPERVGQPRTGRLDTSIVVLDGLGLLLFLVPGLIAFIVDFATGAIYLPPEHYGASEQPEQTTSGLVKLTVPPGELTRERLEQAVTRAHGRPVSLERGTYRAVQLRSVDEFRTTVATLEKSRLNSEVTFRCQSP